MKLVNSQTMSDSLHRLAKLALDSGEVSSLEEAMALFETYELHVVAGASLVSSAAQQAALLTVVNAGCRSFLGGVTVSGLDRAPALVPTDHATIDEEVIAMGAKLDATAARSVPHIVIGDGVVNDLPDFCVKVVLSGWGAASVPFDVDHVDDPGAFVLAGIAGGAVALSEAFQHVRGSNPAAGKRVAGISLWDSAVSWDQDDMVGQQIPRLPNSAWIIGLGNLGQAYLWSFGMLPYCDPGQVHLTLQDFDYMAQSNISTSLLTRENMIGQRKTRAIAAWAEGRGFDTTIVERRFDDKFEVTPFDPAIALCGVDNGTARAALEDVGFGRILEAGLGNGISDYLALRFHSFPARRKAREIWKMGHQRENPSLDLPAYQELAEKGVDRCGLVQLAGRTIGAPFVGALAGAIVVSELVKLTNGGPSTALLDMHLRAPQHLEVVKQDARFAFNPGGIPAAQKPDVVKAA